MKTYLSKLEAIVDLHERGYTEDFELSGNDLLWIQQKVFLEPWEFLVTECYRYLDKETKETVILAVESNFYNAKGILINHSKKHIPARHDTLPGNCIKADAVLRDYSYTNAFFAK